MIESGSRSRFVQQPPLRVRVVGAEALGVEELEGNAPAEPRIARQIHGPHPAASQRAENLVRPDAAGRFWRHRWRPL